MISHKWSYGLANSGTAITVECESTRAQGRLDGVGNRHERWIVQDRGHEIGWPVPLRLRVGVLLILLWIVPFWALAPFIANSLSGLSNPPSDAAVTTTILVVQTILGPLGFWGRQNGSQVDHQGLHEEACPRGHLVHTPARGNQRSARRRQ